MTPWPTTTLATPWLPKAEPTTRSPSYHAAIRIRPNYAEAHYNLGNALHDKGRLDDAIDEYRAAIRIKPDYAEAHTNLGLALRVKGRLDDAIAEYYAAIRIKPDYAEAHTNLGNALRDKGRIDEAIDEYHAAIRIKPNDALAHNNLGLALRDKGRIDDAIDELHAAIRIKPDLAGAHYNLGLALRDKGRIDDAIDELNTAIRIKPDSAKAHTSLGNVLRDKGRIDDAIAEYHAAIRIKPEDVDAHMNLGIALRLQGKFNEALDSMKKARESARANPGLLRRIQQVIAPTERFASLAARLPAVIQGKERPKDAAEAIEFASMCIQKKYYVFAAKLYEQAFRDDPKLAENLQAGHRYNAACAAALAGCGQGKDDPQPNDAEKTRLRKQALDWLKADLAVWTKQIDNEAQRKDVERTLRHWKVDADLAGIRDEPALASTPESERGEWKELWKKVNALIKKLSPENEKRK